MYFNIFSSHVFFSPLAKCKMWGWTAWTRVWRAKWLNVWIIIIASWSQNRMEFSSIYVFIYFFCYFACRYIMILGDVFSVIIFCLFFNCISLMCTLLFLLGDVSTLEGQSLVSNSCRNSFHFVAEFGKRSRSISIICCHCLVHPFQPVDLLHVWQLDYHRGMYNVMWDACPIINYYYPDEWIHFLQFSQSLLLM